MDLCKELELVHKKYKDRLHLSQGVQVLRKDHMNHKQVLHKDHKQVQVERLRKHLHKGLWFGITGTKGPSPVFPVLIGFQVCLCNLRLRR
jgi:hypothetical protein